MTKKAVLGSTVAVVCMMMSVSAMARSDEGFHFRVGLGYSSAITDIGDFYEDAYNESHRYTQLDVTTIPVGLELGLSHKWSYGGRADLTFGPAVVALGDLEYYDFPFALTYGHDLALNSSFGVYIRGGLALHFVGGDYDPESDLGFVGALGVEIFRDRAVTMGLEVGIDTAEVEFLGGAKTLDAHGSTASIYALF